MTVILCILDGWGYSTDTKYNAIAHAHTPNWNHLCEFYPYKLLHCSGKYVGLPDNQAGNSEVGHLHLGSGQLVLQDLLNINQNLDNVSLQKIIDKLDKNSAIHLIGLCSEGGVHSHLNHIIKLYHRLKSYNIYLHFISDGRDTLPKSMILDIEKLKNQCPDLKIMTIIGRQYAMDRNNNDQYTNYAFQNILQGHGKKYNHSDLQSLIHEYYNNGLTDEFIPAMTNAEYSELNGIRDIVLFCNFRIDRIKQLAKLFIDNNIICFSLVDYNIKEISYLFPKNVIQNTLSESISKLGLKQLHIAESEKFPHVTYFFNGNRYHPFSNEDWICIPSIKNSNYKLNPEMSAFQILEKVLSIYCKYDFILVNFANADMVGHTGDFNATVKAIEILDHCLGQLMKINCPMIITSDHGNAELMYDIHNNQIYNQHTTNKVPCILYKMPICFNINNIDIISDIKDILLRLL